MFASRDRMDQAHRAYAAAHGELLDAVASLSESGEWQGDGAGNLASWLSARYQVCYRTAREWVSSAGALRQRASLSDAYRAGSVSGDQMRALVTLSEPGGDHDGAWLEGLAFWDIAELEREARKVRARELERSDDGRYLRLGWTPDERFMKVDGRLHPEEGALVMKALDRRLDKDLAYGAWDFARADALVAMAAESLSGSWSGGGDPDRATVVVHLDQASLAGEGGAETIASLEAGGFVGVTTAERLCCDARIETVWQDGSKRPVGIGRASRKVPPWLYRQLRRRDLTCVFSGCPRDKFLEAHHRLPWWAGGPTDLDNLSVKLCPLCLASLEASTAVPSQR